MSQNKKILLVLLVLVVVGVVAFMFVSDSPKIQAVAESEVVQIINDEQLGQYLADYSGRTLYSFDFDNPSISNCYNSCLDNWIPFPVDGAMLAKNPGLYMEKVNFLKKKNINAISRRDGAVQFTYREKPLYYFKGDLVPGDIKGIREVGNLILLNGY